MTTVAADRYGMAADSYFDDGSRAAKVLRGTDCIVGYAGDGYYGIALARWWIGGRRGPPPNQHDIDRDDRAELLVLTREGMSTVNYEGIIIQLSTPYGTIGSGCDAAMAAMLAGAPPEFAVEIACQLDSRSKLPVHYEALRRRPKS
jgi:hypothetical protein